MSQKPFEDRMHQLLDRRLAPEDDEALRAQAAADDQARQVLLAQQALFEGLRASETPEPSDDFAEQVVARVSAPDLSARNPRSPLAATQSRKRSRGRFWLTIVCAASLLALAIPFWSNWRPQAERNVTNNPSHSQPDADVADFKEAPAVAAKTDVQASVDDDDASPQEDLPQELPRQPSPPESPSLVDVEVDGDQREAKNAMSGDYEEFEGMYQAFLERLPTTGGEDDLLALRPQWVDEVAVGLKPVATSLGGAINALRRNLPPANKAEPRAKPQAGASNSASRHSVA